MSSFTSICSSMQQVQNELMFDSVTAALADVDSETPDDVLQYLATEFLQKYTQKCERAVQELGAQQSSSILTAPPGFSSVCQVDDFTTNMGWIAPQALQMQVHLAKTLRDSSDLAAVKADPLAWLGQQRNGFAGQTNWCQRYPQFPNDRASAFFESLVPPGGPGF